MALRLAVSGATGRMGQTILGLAAKDPRFGIVGALESPQHAGLGKPLDLILPSLGPQKATLEADPAKFAVKPQVLIDFTHPTATTLYLDQAAALGFGMVIGTTGLTEADKEKIKQASARVPVVQATNMSLGMNLLFALVEEAAAKLGPAYDAEIVEAHHHFKKDAPSGSALSLGESVARAWGVKLSEFSTHGREGQVGERKAGTIGFHAVRGGDIVGDHTVMFAGTGERLELTHRAQSRESFAQGALTAALFLGGKAKGLFDMLDVLGLRRTSK
ncbi:MAG TPA: 4-hydroxy-tetrahydrodipicolinate reductase [bacterium]|nr:4-hydroxy-tetrahydrodipicolinate reductase [bacterium]